MDVAEFKNKRLLMTADTVGGVWTYALELIKALEPYGLEVHLATMGKLPSEAQQAEAASLSNLRLHQSDFALEWMDQPWEQVQEAGKWLLALEQQLQPHLIHLNNYCHGQLHWQAPVLMVGHSCVRSWWQAVKGEAAPDAYTTYAQKVKEGLQAADLVVAPTKAYLEQLRYYYGPFAQEAVVPNARDARLFKAAPKEDYILSVGRLWDEAKNIAACEEAAARLEWPIEVAGDTQHPGYAEAQTYTHLKALGKLSPSAVAAKMAKAAIYVMPAKYEPFGLSILEAALSGCALVLGDIPSLRENWEGAALFADPARPEAILEKLDYLIQHPLERKRLGALAAERALAFSPEKQAATNLALYQNLLSQRWKDKAAQRTKPEHLVF